jgi:hypothetical protein
VNRIKDIARAQRTTLVVYSVVYAYDPSLPLEFSQFEQLPARDLFIWVIQPTGDIAFRHVSFARRPESLVDLVRAARESIGAPDPAGPRAGASGTGEDPRRNYPHLRHLHDVLIGPIAGILPTDPATSVTFIPQDVLFLVPFAALQDGKGIHLVERHAIVTAPSVQILDLVSRPDKDAVGSPSSALIVGNPKMPRVRRGSEGPPETLDRLPGSEQEAIAIARLLNSQAMIGEQATKAMVVSRMARADLVHLATHGLVDGVAPDFSALALAPDKNDPGLLTAREIRALRLKGDLVVLSACETARGKITGDGIGGLSRSFLAAGARSLVVSLWQVADAATGVLMTSFYEHLKQGQDKAQALRQAMLETRKKYPDPRRWAAFTLIGSADTSDGLRALMKGTAGAAAREAAGRQAGVDRDPYRYFVFPLPDGARDYREHAGLAVEAGGRVVRGGEVDATFSTGLGAGELMSFYRSELTRRGLREDTELTQEDTRGFQLVFKGLPGGKLVIQGTAGGGGYDSTVSLRVEPLQP